LVVIVALALGLALAIQAWVVKPYQIPSESMEPTLDVGQRILVNRFIYHLEDPGVGDIVVFHPPAGAEEEGIGGECGSMPKNGAACDQPTSAESSENFVKRIVAGPGDTVQVIHGQAIVNGEASDAANGAARENCGKPLPESQWKTVSADGNCNFPAPITIPPDHYFMMGDNRAFSKDSRFWGPIPRDWIIGKAFATYWPPDRIGIF
jgi:signal peptidase I